MRSVPDNNSIACDNRKLGDPGNPGFKVDRYPFYLLNRAVSRYNIVIEARLRTIGLDIPNWRVLMVLGERMPRSVGELADAAVINLSTMLRIVQRMEKAGLVSSEVKPDDARVRQVFLAAAGSDLLAAAREITAPVYAGVITGFSASDFDRLIGLIGRLQENLDALPGDTDK